MVFQDQVRSRSSLPVNLHRRGLFALPIHNIRELHLNPLSASAPPVVDCRLSRCLLARSRLSAAFKGPLRSRDNRRKTAKSRFRPRFPEPLEHHLGSPALALGDPAERRGYDRGSAPPLK